MRSDEGRNPAGNEAGTGRRRYVLWYIQHEGSRSYVRVTGLGLLAAVIFTLIPALLILTLFFRNETQQQRDLENVNINMRGEPRAPGNYNHIIPAPPPPPLATPRVSRSPRGGDPSRQTPAAPNLNVNAPLTPSPTPSLTPPRLPS
jgi:hypothetical protein